MEYSLIDLSLSLSLSLSFLLTHSLTLSRSINPHQDIETSQPDIPTLPYAIVYPQQEQELPTVDSSPESNRGRDEGRILQPSTNNGYSNCDFLAEGKVDDKPDKHIIAVSDRLQCPQDNCASMKGFAATISHVESDREPLLK